jgi:LemA protein
MNSLYVLIGVAVVAGIFFLWAVSSYNGLVSLREKVKNAKAQIDVLLKRRYDLIPNLVETVKGYASHERETLERVISARNAAVTASASGDTASIGKAEGQLNGALRQLFAVSEAYPDLKANQNFMQLQGELVNTENQIAQGGGGFNNVVKDYNTTLMSFPTNLIAGIFGFRAEPYFEITNPTEREVPKVKF